MSFEELVAVSSARERWRPHARLLAWVLPCVLCATSATVHAQATTSQVWAVAAAHEQRGDRPTRTHGPDEPARGAPVVSQPTALELGGELGALRAAVERAEFDDAQQRAVGLLQRPSLRAHERNDTLELLAIAQIATRKDALARATLAELFARDPEHPQRMRDPGPNVESFFARVRAQAHEPVTVSLHVSALRDAHARVLVEVELERGQDAVDSVHVLSPAQAALGERDRSEHAIEPTHVVADVHARGRLTLQLPPLSLRTSVVELYVEARAPSGYVLGQRGTASTPLRLRLEPDQARPLEPEPVRRAWWLWTGLGVAVSAIVISGAVLSH